MKIQYSMFFADTTFLRSSDFDIYEVLGLPGFFRSRSLFFRFFFQLGLSWRPSGGKILGPGLAAFVPDVVADQLLVGGDNRNPPGRINAIHGFSSL